MKTVFDSISVVARSESEKKASSVLLSEVELRSGKGITTPRGNILVFQFEEDGSIDSRDSFSVEIEKNKITAHANGIRGFIYAIGLFLRKTEYTDNKIVSVADFSGTYSPDKPIRGHQLGYRPLSNTYDAWSVSQYRRAYLDMMYFGANTVEHIPSGCKEKKSNALMKYNADELLRLMSEYADEVDLDVSLWLPNSEDNVNEALEYRERLFSSTKRIDAVFPPGGDPGSLSADEFVHRCGRFKEILSKTHPFARLFPSAQAPHSIPGWGEAFIKEISDHDYGIDGIITGPNHAFPIDELRRRTPARYPIRFYPDITHNLRCEHPVHFDTDDWNFALAGANGREAINPRPVEYAKLHRLYSRYTAGSVSYSEGVNDDVNKAVWTLLEWNSDTDIREAVEDYARLFFYGASISDVTDGIFGLEKNWEGAPQSNPQIENTLRIFEKLGRATPSLYDNWRYLMCLFRAKTDAYVRRRVLFDSRLISDAKSLIKRNRLNEAYETLSGQYPSEITDLRNDLENIAESLFDKIGIQLGTKRFHADGWERGAVLDTADNPVTDREWLTERLKTALNGEADEPLAYMLRSIDRNLVSSDEYYFSVALNGLDSLGEKQNGEFYIDTQADRPDKNNGGLPTSLFKLYDHFSFHAKLGGFKFNTDYVLMITYSDSVPDEKCDFKIKANGNTVYSGDRLGGSINEKYTSEMLPKGFTAVMYKLPSECFENGCIELEITEPFEGFKFGEFRITKKPYGEN